MTTAESNDLDELRRQARLLAGEVSGPVARIKLSLGEASLEIEFAGSSAPSSAPAPSVPAAPAGPSASAPAAASPVLSAVPDVPEGTPVPAPLVGTFYRAPGADEAAYVDVGDRVEAGQQVGIVEAMKLLNRIDAPVAGTVVAIAVENAEMVEFGQVLLYIQEE